MLQRALFGSRGGYTSHIARSLSTSSTALKDAPTPVNVGKFKYD